MNAHRKRYQLGFGITVEFIFKPAECRKGALSYTALVCEWTPAVPKFKPGHAKNKFLRRYAAARDDFLSDAAQMLGRSIVSIDLDENCNPSAAAGFKPVVPSLPRPKI